MGVPIAYLCDRRVLTHPRMIFRMVWLLACFVFFIVLCVCASAVAEPLFLIIAGAPRTLLALSIVGAILSTFLSIVAWVPLVSRLRRFFLPANLVFLALTGVFAFSYVASFGSEAAQARLFQVCLALAGSSPAYGPSYRRPQLLGAIMDRDADGKYFWQGKAEKFFEWWHGLTTTPGVAVAWTGSIWLILNFASVMMLYREDTLIALVTTDASDQVPDDESDEY
jgi:hypothetical protein